VNIATFALGPLETNGYLLSEGREALFIDPGGDPAMVLQALKSGGLTLQAVVLTHFHFDHIAGTAALAKATGAPVLADPGGGPLLATEIGGGGRGFMGFPPVPRFAFEPLLPGERTFIGHRARVLATPGHAPGSVSIHFPDARAVFVGDLVFWRSIGRHDFQGGDLDTLLASVRREIFPLPPETAIYPGHGPATTVGEEKLHNPFFTGGGF